MGYSRAVLEELMKTYHDSEYHFFIEFRWSKDKRPVQLPDVDKKLILIMLIDETGFLPTEVPSKVFAVFKMMAKPENLIYPNVFHIPQGPNFQVMPKESLPIVQRGYSVFFSGNLHSGRERLYKFFSGAYMLPFPILHRVASLLGRNFDKRYKKGFIRFTKRFRTGLSSDSYSSILYNSKIVLCPPGNPNAETMRLFEAMRAGCIIITDAQLPEVYTYIGAPIIKVKKWRELDEIVPQLLSNPTNMQELQNITLDWWSSHCSEKAIATYISECIKKLE